MDLMLRRLIYFVCTPTHCEFYTLYRHTVSPIRALTRLAPYRHTVSISFHKLQFTQTYCEYSMSFLILHLTDYPPTFLFHSSYNFTEDDIKVSAGILIGVTFRSSIKDSPSFRRSVTKTFIPLFFFRSQFMYKYTPSPLVMLPSDPLVLAASHRPSTVFFSLHNFPSYSSGYFRNIFLCIVLPWRYSDFISIE